MQAVRFQGALVLAMAFFAGLAYLPHIGVGFFDQANSAYQALAAKKLIEHGRFDAIGHPPLTVLLLAGSFLAGGYTAFAARFSVLVIFLAGGFFTYKLGKTVHSSSAGLIASFLYFFSPLLVRGVFAYWIDALLMVFVSASACFLAEYSEKRNPRFMLYGGIFAGFAILAKEAALLLFPIYFFVFRRDGRMGRLLCIMAFFVVAWLAAYELLDSSAYLYALEYHVNSFFVPELGRGGESAAASILWFVQRMGAVVFLLAMAGGVRFIADKRRARMMCWLIPSAFLFFFSLSSTKHIKYYFPAVPFLLVLASVAIVGFAAIVARAGRLRILALIPIAYLLGAYAMSFFSALGDVSGEWAGSPKASLLDFVLERTDAADRIAVIDDSNSNWITFYTGRPVYSVPFTAASEMQYSLVLDFSPRFLVVRTPAQQGMPAFSKCNGAGELWGRDYNYSVYRCDWR